MSRSRRTFSREAWQKSRLDAYAVQKHVLSRFTVAAILTSDGCVSFVRRELKRLSGLSGNNARLKR